MKRRFYKRSALLACGLLLVLMSIPLLLTAQAWRQERLDRELMQAAQNNNLQAVVILLKQGANPNARQAQETLPSLAEWLRHRWRGQKSPEESGDPLLTTLWRPSCFAGSIPENIPLLRALIRAGADVNATDTAGNTVLLGAVHHENNRIVALLLKQGSDVNKANQDGITPLMRAAEQGNLAAARLLRRYHARLAPQNGGVTVLMRACIYEDQVEMVRFLLREGADPNMRVPHWHTALWIAHRFHHPHVAALLKQAGATE